MTWHLGAIQPAKYWQAPKAASAGSEMFPVAAKVQKDASVCASTQHGGPGGQGGGAGLFCSPPQRSGWVLQRANGFLFSRYHCEIRKCFHFIFKCYFQFLRGTEKLNDLLKVTWGVFGKMQKKSRSSKLQPAALITTRLCFGTDSAAVVRIKTHYPRYSSSLFFLMKFICSSYQLAATLLHDYQWWQSEAHNSFPLFLSSILVDLGLICSLERWRVRCNLFLMIQWL